MRSKQLFAWALPVLVTGAVVVGIIGTDDVPPDFGLPPSDGSGVVALSPPVAAQDRPTNPILAAMRETAAIPEYNAATDVAIEPTLGAAGHDAAGQTEPFVAVPYAPPPSEQTLVDQRREVPRQLHDAQVDAYGGRRGYRPRETATYDDAVERYRDAVRRGYRQQRDYRRSSNDNWMDAMCPWSKPKRDWPRKRSIGWQTEQLERREARDAWWYGPPYPFTGPVPW